MNLVKNEKLENNSHELQFSIDAVTFSAAVDKAFKKEVAKYNIPGFRKGKAPLLLRRKQNRRLQRRSPSPQPSGSAFQ